MDGVIANNPNLIKLQTPQKKFLFEYMRMLLKAAPTVRDISHYIYSYKQPTPGGVKITARYIIRFEFAL
ncbi:MAG: hypothetical protein V4615_00990 [Bacteroidota bacterium]